jgi:endonuclease/exonuclease/phosphatase family metal-dependent hydrolase
MNLPNFLLVVLAIGISFLPASADEIVRIMAANTTSGNGQSYDPGDGIRIFQGLDPDIVMIQEFNYGNDTPSDFRDFVDLAFGTEYSYYREGGGEQIPNGVISRYPIIQSGEWNDSNVSNRDFAWAQIDIPGDKNLWAVSVHFLTSNASDRNSQANALISYIQNQVPANDYVVVAGDFNADSFSESQFNTLSTVVNTSGRPNDQNGTTGTNASRAKPYDQVLPSSDLNALETPVTISGHSFTYSDGLVFDSRIFTPISAVNPAQSADSGAPSMQHMAVIRDFLIPTTGGSTEPAAYPTNLAGNAAPDSIGLSWTDSIGVPLPNGYLIKASTSPAIAAPVDGVNVSQDSNLSDGSAQVIVSAGTGDYTFSGLPFETTYYFRIYPFTNTGAIDYKTGGIPPSLTIATLPDAGSLPAAPTLTAVYYPHASGFTVTWDKVADVTNYRIDISENPTFSGAGGATLIDENFDASDNVPAGWVNGSTVNDTLSSHYNSASNCRALGSNDTLETSSVNFPAALSFYVDASGGGDGQAASASYSIGGGVWQPLATFSVSTGGNVETIDLSALSSQSDVQFRFESGFNTWYLDDVLVTGSSGAGFVVGYEDLALGNVSQLAVSGLDPNMIYYYRIRAENAVGISANSATGSATTTLTGTPYSVWATANGIAPADGTSDFDSDSLTDFEEYVFATDPKIASTQSDWFSSSFSDGDIQITHRRSFAPGITWEYFGNDDLSPTSTPLSEAQYDIIIVENLGSYEEVTLSINTGAAPRFFFWIKATAP